MPDKTTLYETCRDAADHLPGAWRVIQDSQYANYCTLRREADGLELLVHLEGPRISVGLPAVVAVAGRRYVYPERGPYLRFSSRRSSPDIGRIIGHLLEPAAIWWGIAQAWKEAIERGQNRQALLVEAGSLPDAQPTADGWTGHNWELRAGEGETLTLVLHSPDPARLVETLKRFTAA